MNAYSSFIIAKNLGVGGPSTGKWIMDTQQ